MYRYANHFFVIYNLVYTLKFFPFVAQLFTVSGLREVPVAGLSPQGELVFGFSLLIFRVFACLGCLLLPQRVLSWGIFLLAHGLVFYFSGSVALVFIATTHIAIVNIFFILSQKISSIKLFELTKDYGFATFQILHFSSAISKVFERTGAWRSGSALEIILTRTMWARDLNREFAAAIAPSVFVTLTYIVLFLELANGFFFIRKVRALMVWNLLIMHSIALIFFSLEEISVGLIACALCLLTLDRVNFPHHEGTG